MSAVGAVGADEAVPVVLVVQHEDECPPAWFGRWIADAGCALDVRRPYAGDELPDDLSGHHGLLVLGGHMGANDDADHPWLSGVKELVRDAVFSETPTFGICLGHQLVAVALGGTVERSPRGQQLGVLPVGWVGSTDPEDPVLATRPAEGIQWNNDIVVELPPEARALAQTADGDLQVCRFAPTVWGVQLHPEADPDVVRPWADADRPQHGDVVIDAALAAVREASPRLLDQWRPVAERFAALVRTGAHAAHP